MSFMLLWFPLNPNEGKYETAISDIALALALIGFKNISTPNLQKYENTRYLMRERYDKVMLGAVRNLYRTYANDFRLFEYDLHEFLDLSFN